MAQWARDLSGEDFTGFSPLGSQFGEDSSTLNASLSGVSRELTALNSEISDARTVSGCGGWGSVTSESGDYVGGVAGLSLSSIRASYAKCALSGGKYAGGIAGSGSRVRDCISMVEITDCAQLAGAVAGEVTGEYCGNRFVSDTLTAIAAVITLVIRKRRAKAAKRAQ